MTQGQRGKMPFIIGAILLVGANIMILSYAYQKKEWDALLYVGMLVLIGAVVYFKVWRKS